jgi:hypothetical protein
MTARMRWVVRPRAGGGWEGEVTLETGVPAESLSVTRHAESPGEAVEGALTAASDVCGALDEAGFLPFGDILSTVLDTASDVARAVGGRARRGESPGPSETKLPGPLAAVAATSAMRPGAPGYGAPGFGYGAPSPFGAPPGWPGAPSPYAPPAPPGWPVATWSKPGGGWS